jgi:DNA repair protein RadD
MSKRSLQEAIGDELLARLEGLGPALFPKSADPATLYRRENLLNILFSFSSGHLMKDSKFLRTLLNSLPKEELEALSSATQVGQRGASFAEKLEQLVKKGWSDPQYCEAFIRQAGLPKSFLPLTKQVLPPTERIAPPTTPFKRLKPYQYSLYDQAMVQLAIPRSRFVMHMPTGSGKTRTSMEFIVDTLNKASSNSVIVWIAHSEELCEQAIQCFKEVWAHIGQGQTTIYRGYGASCELPKNDVGKVFLCGGFQKLYSLLKKDKNVFNSIQERSRLVIIDEAHKATAPTYEKVTKALIGNETCLVGLTATPGRGIDSTEQNEKLANLFFNQVVGIKPPLNETVFTFLRKQKVLAEVVIEKLLTSRTYILTSAQIRKIEREFDFPSDFLTQIGADDIRNVEIVKRIRVECEAGKQVLFFACSIENSRFICALLNLSEIQAAHIDGGTDRGERAEKIGQFRSGKLQVLCNYGVLSTGFDAPNTDVVFISRPTKSIVLYSQMIGRGLRGTAIGGTEKCKVINVIDNIKGLPPSDSIYDYFEEYWVGEQ